MQLVQVFLNFSALKHQKDCRNAFPPPSPQSMLFEGLRFHQGNFGGKATLSGIVDRNVGPQRVWF